MLATQAVMSVYTKYIYYTSADNNAVYHDVVYQLQQQAPKPRMIPCTKPVSENIIYQMPLVYSWCLFYGVQLDSRPNIYGDE